MPKPPNQLALRPLPSGAPPQKVVFTRTDHAHQYPIDPTTLGDFAIRWTAEWFNGTFSVTDLPAEWVAHVQTTFHGQSRVSSYSGPAQFSLVLWNAAPCDDQISAWVFSQVQVVAGDMGDVLDNILDSLRDTSVRPWDFGQPLLPHHATLALPDEHTSVL